MRECKSHLNLLAKGLSGIVGECDGSIVDQHIETTVLFCDVRGQVLDTALAVDVQLVEAHRDSCLLNDFGDCLCAQLGVARRKEDVAREHLKVSSYVSQTVICYV